MRRASERLDGWRGAALVAITYVYFLIFAQFAFLARLGECGVAETALKTVMAAMAAGGVLFSLLTPALVIRFAAARLLRFGLAACALAALLSLAPLNYPAAIAVAFLAGSGLGLLTITVVSHLPRWAGRRNPVLMAGVGAGIAYFICNVPAVFTASPSSQALLAALLCAAGLLLPAEVAETEEVPAPAAALSFRLALLSFAALVWLDSAAFYIIQHTAALKAGTWMGDLHLWANACIHLAAAILAALLLGSRRVSLVLAAAVLALGFACILLHRPDLSLSASLFYPAGVSFYSVALVAYPAFLSGSVSLRDRARRAGWIYALAGWVASALGIGMGQHLGEVPVLFVAIAGAVVLVPALLILLHTRTREAAVAALAAVLAFIVWRMLPATPIAVPAAAAERGRQVYISEGCISCHSQYVRPGTADQLMWGPVQSLEQVHQQSPPLIGNRRQGPDLAEIGSRRSPLWLKAHLIAPASLSSDSPMPSYAVLFRDGRGDDLVAYMASLASRDSAQAQMQAAWQPPEIAWQSASADDGATLYKRHCSTCHDSGGEVRQQWAAQFNHFPKDPPAMHAYAGKHSRAQLAQVVRFGIAGTDMPGHEFLSEGEIASLAIWLSQSPAQPLPLTTETH